MVRHLQHQHRQNTTTHRLRQLAVALLVHQAAAAWSSARALCRNPEYGNPRGAFADQQCCRPACTCACDCQCDVGMMATDLSLRRRAASAISVRREREASASVHTEPFLKLQLCWVTPRMTSAGAKTKSDADIPSLCRHYQARRQHQATFNSFFDVYCIYALGPPDGQTDQRGRALLRCVAAAVGVLGQGPARGGGRRGVLLGLCIGALMKRPLIHTPECDGRLRLQLRVCNGLIDGARHGELGGVGAQAAHGECSVDTHTLSGC